MCASVIFLCGFTDALLQERSDACHTAFTINQCSCSPQHTVRSKAFWSGSSSPVYANSHVAEVQALNAVDLIEEEKITRTSWQYQPLVIKDPP
jgi:hypothetical protein